MHVVSDSQLALCMQIPLMGSDDEDISPSNGASIMESGADDDASMEEKKEAVGESVAGVVQALTELASAQTPASVWLPSKHLTVQLSGKVKFLEDSRVYLESRSSFDRLVAELS